jgi:hypothetical protein
VLLLLAAMAACAEDRSLPAGDGGVPADATPQGPCVPRLGDPVVKLPPATLNGFSVNPYDLIVADVDGDGLTDIVGSGLTGGDNGGYVYWAVFTNPGGGAFTLRQATAGGGHFVLGDVTADGAPDLIAQGDRAVLVNDGTGFFAPRNAVLPARLFPLALGDLDGDGALDVVGTTAEIADGPVVFVRNLGDGTFAAPATIAAGAGAIALGDVDGDGRLDVVVGSATDRTVVVHRQQADGTFAEAAWEVGAAGDGAEVASITLADLDADGLPDLLVVSERSWSAGPEVEDSLAVRLNAGGGDFGALAIHPLGEAVRTIAVGDLDGDGTADVATFAEGTTLFLRLNDGHGALGAPVAYAFADLPRSYLYDLAWYPVAIADVDADGRLDVVMPGAVLLNRGCAP